MPKRTKSSVLEDQSRIKFAAALPSEWVVRDIPRDFGIDSEVEIFEDEAATGLLFKVQLKATETLAGKKAAVSVKLDQVRYWNSLDNPVLVVLYIADEDKLYGKWCLSHDPGKNAATKKWTSIDFEDADLLHERIPAIPDEIVMTRSIKAGKFPVPVPLRVKSELPAISRYQILRSIRQKFEDANLTDLVRLVSDEQQPAIEANFKKQVLRVAMPLNAGSMSLHAYTIDEDIAADADTVADNLCALVGALFNLYDRHVEASRLLKSAWPCAAMLSVELSDRFAHSLAESGDLDFSVTIADALTRSGIEGIDDIIQLYMWEPHIFAGRLSEESRKQLVAVHLWRSKQALQGGDEVSAGADYFNIANVLKKDHLYGDALDYLDRARVLKPAYEESAVYQEILGQVAFHANDPRRAAEAYKRAAELEPATPKVDTHFADALFWSGEYQSALQHIEERGLDDPLAIVNLLALKEIVDGTGVERQHRRPMAADEQQIVEADHSQALRYIQEVDALLPLLWLRYDDDIENWSLTRLMLHCKLDLDYAPFWAMATIEAYVDESARAQYLPQIVESALREGPDNYLDVLVEMLEDVDDDISRPVKEYVFEAATKVREPSIPFTVIGRDGLPVVPTAEIPG